MAQQAFEILKEGPHRENGQISESEQMRYKTIVLTAKEKICFCDKAECNPDYCPMSKGIMTGSMMRFMR